MPKDMLAAYLSGSRWFVPLRSLGWCPLLTRTIVCMGIAIGMWAGTRQAGAAGLGPPHTVRELLELYGQGHFDVVVADFSAREGRLPADLRRGAGPLARFFDEIKRTSASWIVAGGSTGAPERRLVVAGLALEAAHAIPALYGRTHYDAQLDERYALLNWAPTILMQDSVPLAAERWWWLAAIASIQGQADISYSISRGEALLRLARVRFPDERRFTLQQGLLEDQHVNPPLVTFPGTVPGLSPSELGAVVVEDPSGRVDIASVGSTASATSFSPGDIRSHIREATRAFSSLLDDSVLGPEAQLHLGSVELRLNAPALAASHLERAVASLSSSVARYDGFLFLAGAYARLREGDKAEAALRAAAALVPGTDSEVRMLAWLCANSGRQAEASRLMTEHLRSAETPDPWFAYEAGDATRWDEFIGRLRQGLRR